MPVDKTRVPVDPRQDYRGIAAQQGRVILDRDLNALQTFANEALQRETRDVIGPFGTPDNGFAITVPPPQSLIQPIRPTQPAIAVRRGRLGRPPVRPGLASFPAPDPWDFRINPGTMYLGGLRARFAPPPEETAISYDHQPDWLSPTSPDPNNPPKIEFIYLEATQQEVGAVEDDDLRDVALGGPDTAGRLRLMQRVKRIEVAHAACGEALDDAAAAWLATGFALDRNTMRLAPRMKLKVGFTTAQAFTDPCEPASTGGYLEADNQLIRVMVTGAGSLVWGYDNAAFLYAVSPQPDGRTLQFAQQPVDAYHRPATNQAVEVLRCATVLPNGAQLAEATGRITTLAQPYKDDGTVVLTDPLTEAEAGDEQLFLRIWQQTADFTAGLPAPLGNTGLSITLQAPVGAEPGTPLSIGAYWMIAVRPSTPQQVYPERLLQDFQPADGPDRWVCPLAVIDWTADGGPAVTDCRAFFNNLVELSRRQLGGCCTFTLRPADLAQQDPIEVIDALIGKAGIPAATVTICLAAGEYSLVKPFRFVARHRGITLASCAGIALLSAANESDPDFLDGLVVVDQTSNITVRGIAFLPPAVPFGASLIARQLPNAQFIADIVARVFGKVVGMVGLRVSQSTAVRVLDCLFHLPDPGTVAPFAVGVFPSGQCPDLTVENCRFEGLSAPLRRDIASLLHSTAPSPALARLRLSGVPETSTSVAAPAESSAIAETGPAATASAAESMAAAPSFDHLIALADATTLLSGSALGRAAAQNQRLVGRLGVACVDAMTLIDNQGNPSPQTVLSTRADALTISGCSFTGILAGVVIAAGFGMARLQDNSVTKSASGFLVATNRYQSLPPSDAAMRLLLAALGDSNANATFALSMSEIYPLPSAVPPSVVDTTALPVLQVLNNRLVAMPQDGSSSSFGLLITAAIDQRGPDPGAMATISGNQVFSVGAPTTHIAGLLGAVVVTGNVFMNAAAGAKLSCLSISATTGQPPLALTLTVTGNTLRGSHNLAANPRLGFNAPLNDWSFANATF